MNQPAKNLAKVTAFGGFVLFSIAIGTGWVLQPPAPTRVGDGPYAVSLAQLAEYRDQLEGQPVVVTSEASAVSVNDTSGDVQFTISHDVIGISERVLLEAWAPGGIQPAGSAIGNGTLVVVKGVCKLASEGVIVGTEVHVLAEDYVYILSLSGLVAVVAMLFAFFRLDARRLKFRARPRRGKGTRSGGA
ncbi:MAG: hypothetical protein JW839_12045 [Candidatus Lokiarchaeota archaeon]|nr:hypothetical protein [Candidatus Lokiarchaeota archaeon]